MEEAWKHPPVVMKPRKDSPLHLARERGYGTRASSISVIHVCLQEFIYKNIRVLVDKLNHVYIRNYV